MAASSLIDQLIDAFRCLPGVGPKSAQRMTYYLLEKNRDGARRLAQALVSAAERVGYCKRCRGFSESELCSLCSDPRRDQSLVCVVETPADVIAVEHTTAYRGLYFVLMGHLSPLDGIGPEDIGLDMLAERLEKEVLSEVILATNPTVEGEATAHYIGELARIHKVKATRIAHGVPLGGELEYVDGGTLAHALTGRREM